MPEQTNEFVEQPAPIQIQESESSQGKRESKRQKLKTLILHHNEFRK